MVLLTENERSEEVDMTMDEVLRAVKWLVKERERIRLKSIRARRAKGIPARNFRPKPDPDAPAPEKRPRGRPKTPVDPDAPKRSRGRPRKNPVPDIQVIVPLVEQADPVVQAPAEPVVQVEDREEKDLKISPV
jgi:hypothetical protein